MKPILSLITGTRNRPADFRRLVDSIEAYTNVNWELVCSDASDSQLDNEEVAAERPRIRMIPERPRLGCTKGYNRAFQAARGTYCLWLNDDCEVTSGYAEAAISFMEANPRIGLGALPYSNRGGPFRVNEYEGMVYANFGILRRSLGDQVGWFDDLLTMYGNDNSLAFRVLLAGHGIAEIPGARIIHHEHDDQHRRDNQNGRQEEAEKLRAKYLPHLAEMREVYERCRLVTA